VRAQIELIERVAADVWWGEVTVAELETVRVRLRGLVHLIDLARQSAVYLDIEDELLESEAIQMPGATPGIDWERFQDKAQAYLREHENHIALQGPYSLFGERDVDGIVAILTRLNASAAPAA
jgi:type I restriction enzyme R subunit